MANNFDNNLYIDFNDILINPVDFVKNKFKSIAPNLKLKCKSFSWKLIPSRQVYYFYALCMAILLCKPNEDLTV